MGRLWYKINIYFSEKKAGIKIGTNPSEPIRIHHELRHVLNVQRCKNDVTTSSVNVTMPYVLGDIIKIKLATK